MLQKFERMLNSPSGRLRLLSLVSIGLFVGVIGIFLVTAVVFAFFSVGLPDPNKVIRRDGFSTVILDRNGKTLYDLYDKQNRIPLELTDMPKYLQEATISIEDKEFYKHQGFDPMGMLRSVFNILTFRGLSSGSTLTQQLVKNALLSPEQTVFRKIREIILANQIEKKFSKDQILQMYLNETPYGGAYYGVESASRGYFGKSAKDLTLVESAILAGLPQSPTSYSPYGVHPRAFVGRTKDVLRRMREDNYITAQQELDANRQLQDFKFASVSGTIKAPHFVFYVKDQLVKKYGEAMVESGGLKVTTTLDLDVQEKAEKIVNEEVVKIKPLKVNNGAAVLLNPKTGEILAMVGSYDFFDKDYGTYNVATALRQPGSAGKPFIYAAALNRGYTASQMIMDVKTNYPAGVVGKPDYSPGNYDGKYRGPMQLRFALGNSINTIAVKMTALVGLKEIMQSGFNAGISSWEPTNENMKNVGLSLALGGREVQLLELTSAYGSFAAGGMHYEPFSILKVTDNSGKVLLENKTPTGKRVFTPEVSFIISHILSDNNAREMVFGPVNLLQVPGRTVAVKTGTTDQKRDNWTVGYTPSLVVGVWVGNNDNTVMAPAITSGVTGAAPIWNRLMKMALSDHPREEFSKPDRVESSQIDSFGGGLAHGGDPTRSEYFIAGTQPVAISPIYKKLKISRANGKIANDVEVKSGNYDEKEFIVILENDPVSSDGKNRWQDGINAWIADNKKDDARFHPPTDISDADINSVKINVDSPHDHDQTSSDVQIKAKAFAAHDITKFTLEVDGSERISRNEGNIEQSLHLDTGKHKLKFKATDSAGNKGETEQNIGVNVPWDFAPAATSAGLLIFWPDPNSQFEGFQNFGANFRHFSFS